MKILLTVILLTFTLLSNELKYSKSPYLLQHKDNPVNWMEWSNRAFKKAKKEHKFIFLSIGYSTCHWCHVMARESFEQKDVAKILNRYFVSIKVDKERRVDIDNYYQLGFRVVNHRGGGWPLTVILLPNKKPIFFGTYIPKDNLIEILKEIVSTPKSELNKIAQNINKAIQNYKNAKAPIVKIKDRLLEVAIKNIERNFDYKNGGLGTAPKFPQPEAINLLLNSYAINRDKKALKLATKALDAMAKGGIYDQIEGGFFRYSVDAKWQIPHFEKMLYTNAELISLYSKAYIITKNRLYAEVVKNSIANIDKYFGKNGLYYSASNADSKNEDGDEQEGYYYIFEYEKVLNFLIKNGVNKSKAKEALDYFGIRQMGNFEGGDYSNATLNGKIGKFTKIKKLLQKYRAKKKYPFIDKKINTAWNALYIKAKFDALVVDKKYQNEAIKSLESLLKLIYKNGNLYHQTLLPYKATQKALLEDYSFLTDALISAYTATLDKKYLNLANKFMQKSIKQFYKNGEWFYSNNNFKSKASLEDGSYKSPSAQAIKNAVVLIALNGDYSMSKVVDKTFKLNSAYLNNAPNYYATLLDALVLKKKILVLKANKEKLLNIDFNRYLYPYLYKKATKYNLYQICGFQSCFKSFKSEKNIEKELKSLF